MILARENWVWLRNEPGRQENGIQWELSWIYKNLQYILHALKEKKKRAGREEMRTHSLVYKMSGFYYLEKNFIMKIIILF